MKQVAFNKAYSLMAGLLFTFISCAQTAENRRQAGGTDYDGNDMKILSDYLKTGYSRHTLSLWGAGGVSRLYSHPLSGKTDYGFGGSLGAGYTYFVSRKWGLSLGLEYAFFQSKTDFLPFSGAYETADLLNNPIVYTTSTNGYSEKLLAGIWNIPLLATYETGGNWKFYASAGLKFGFPVSLRYGGSNSVLTASGYYPDYDQTEIWQNDLGYGIFNLNGQKGKQDFGVSLAGTLETGIKWRAGVGAALYTGIFVDYGWNGMAKTGSFKKQFVEYNPLEPSRPLVNSACAFADRLSPFAFGFKIKAAITVGYKEQWNARRY